MTVQQVVWGENYEIEFSLPSQLDATDIGFLETLLQS